MGAFLLTLDGADASSVERSNEMMSTRGLKVKQVLERPGFRLTVYEKRRFDVDSVFEAPNGDFAIGVGTFVYRGRYGQPALESLLADVRQGSFSYEQALGHFAAVLFVEGRLLVLNDYPGMGQIYANEARTIVTTSFLACYASLDSYTPNEQELYEYLTLSMFFGFNTPIREIDRLDARCIHQLLPTLAAERKPIAWRELYAGDSFEEHVEQVHELLREYFQQLVGIFGDAISIGLSGGFDSRLVLAYLRHCGASPRVYVQGPADSPDVVVAKHIATSAGFEIEYRPDETQLDFSPEEFPEQLRNASLYVDGIHHRGLFDAWPLTATRRSTGQRPERLRLYGMAGEILRRTLETPNRICTVDEYFTLQADKHDTSAYTRRFSKRAYFEGMASKLSDRLGLIDGKITPEQCELAYPCFRLPTVTGTQLTNEGERAHALTPFSEPQLAIATSLVPLRYRELARFEAALVRRADRELAAQPTAYGFSLDQGPGLRYRLRRKAIRTIPLALRPHVHRLKQRKQAVASPFFQSPEYIKAVFPEGARRIPEFADISRISDPTRLSRALTLDLLLSGRLAEL